jgi:hypothetical protein
MATKIPKGHKNTNGRKRNQTAIKRTYEHLPLLDPTKFTQIGIFGLKLYHLATLTTNSEKDSFRLCHRNCSALKGQAKGGAELHRKNVSVASILGKNFFGQKHSISLHNTAYFSY